jgi:hypothetical protein
MPDGLCFARTSARTIPKCQRSGRPERIRQRGSLAGARGALDEQNARDSGLSTS